MTEQNECTFVRFINNTEQNVINLQLKQKYRILFHTAQSSELIIILQKNSKVPGSVIKNDNVHTLSLTLTKMHIHTGNNTETNQVIAASTVVQQLSNQICFGYVISVPTDKIHQSRFSVICQG